MKAPLLMVRLTKARPVYVKTTMPTIAAPFSEIWMETRSRPLPSRREKRSNDRDHVPKSIWAYVDTRKQVRDHFCNYLRARLPPKPGFGKMILKVLPSSMKFRPVAKSFWAAQFELC